MLISSKTSEFNFIEKSFKPRQDVRNNKTLKKGKSRKFKCNMLKDKLDKENKDKRKKKNGWKCSLDNRCFKSLPGKIKLSKWPSKNAE